MTLEEWARMDEDETGELVDGQLVEEEDVGAAHESIVAWLVVVLGGWLGGRGRVLTSDTKYAVRPDRGRKPDITVYFTRVQLPARGVVRTPPDIAVEIVTPTPKDRRRDRMEKLHEYADFGVRYYWLVDPEDALFEVLELKEGTYSIRLTASTGVISVPGCEGLSVDLDALWAEIADLEDESD
jgi:Uma2 family endonuclease